MNASEEINGARPSWRVSPEKLYRGGWVVAVILGGFQAGYFLIVHEDNTSAFINDILAIVSGLIAIAGMAYGSYWSYRIDRRLGVAWGWLTLSMIFWAIGDSVWAYYDLVLGEVPYPFSGDIFYLLTYPLFLIGILWIPRQDGKSTHTIWIWLDFFIVVFSAFGIYWNFLIGPALMDRSQPWFVVLVNSAYPVGDFLLIIALMLLVFLPHSPIWLKPLFFLLVGQIMTAIADSIYAYKTINETYNSGDWYNLLFSIGPLILMLGGFYQAVTTKRALTQQRTVPLQLWSGYLTLSRLFVPYIWLFFAYTMLTVAPAAKQAFRPADFSIWVSVIIIMLAVRQVLSTLDNDRLSNELRGMNDNLEKRVAERSSDLIVMNAELRSQMEERKRAEMMLREREERLAHFALHDALTGLPNRSLLSDRLSQALQHYRRTRELFAVLFLDLDNFKFVNDSLGHLPGDQLLIHVGRRLSSIVRAEDTVARLGGDEFVILLERFNNEDFATTIATRILDAMSEPFTLGPHPIYLTASIGVVVAAPEFQNPVEIIRDADIAMYKAKMNGKSHFVIFTPDMRANAADRLALDSDLRQALAQKQFVLHYQPIVSLEAEKLVGLEALIRWQHPTRGLIGPSEFIPMAEANGFIDSITQWTIYEACSQLAEWRHHAPPRFSLGLSVNLSPFSLRRPELFQWVKDSLQRAKLPPHCLTLEIVETALIQDAELAKSVFTDLRSLGIRVSLDDFGVGYSSLGYISEYPIDILKIDHSFVNRITETHKVASVVGAVSNLARELEIDLIAEGIETREQSNILKQLGCRYGQGFFFSEAIPPQELQDKYMKQVN